MDQEFVTADDGTELCLWGTEPPGAGEAVLFVHGGTYPGRPVYGFDPGEALPGVSWLDATAAAGYAGFAIDVRGYGHSDRPVSPDAAPETGVARANTVSGDVLAALEAIRDRFEAVHLVGFSWGTIVCGHLVSERSVEPASLALVAPVYEPAVDFDDVRRKHGLSEPLGGYRTVTKADVRDRWNAQIRSDPPAELRGGDASADPVIDGFWAALRDSNQRVEGDGEPTVLAPNGVLEDIRDACNGDPVYDPSGIAVPTTIVRGGLDAASTRADALALYDALGTRDREKRYVEIGGYTHMLPIETGRLRLFETVEAGLRSPPS